LGGSSVVGGHSIEYNTRNNLAYLGSLVRFKVKLL